MVAKYLDSKHVKQASYMRDWYANKPLVNKTCKNCEVSFESKWVKTVFCSTSCGRRYIAPLITKDCLYCEKPFQTKPSHESRRMFCSRVCSGKAHIGSDGLNWQGGVTYWMDTVRTSRQYQQWRREVLERDAFACRECSSGERLEAHHLKSRASYPELTMDLNNGVTLCLPCHRKVEAKRRRMETV